MPTAFNAPTAKAPKPRGQDAEGSTPTAAVGIAYAEGKTAYADGFWPSAYSSRPVVIGEFEVFKCRMSDDSSLDLCR